MALEGSSHAHDRSEEGVTIWNISSHSEILNVKLILFSDLILMCKMTPPRQLLESSTFASTFKFKQKNSQKVDDDSSNMQRDKTLNDWLKLSMGWTFNWLMQTLQRLMHKSNENNKKTWRYQHMLPQPPALEPYKVTLSLHQEENLLHQPISF